MIITDFVKQTILRIGAVVTIPIRQNVKIESVQVIWNKELGFGEIKMYVNPTCPQESVQSSSQYPPCLPYNYPVQPSHVQSSTP